MTTVAREPDQATFQVQVTMAQHRTINIAATANQLNPATTKEATPTTTSSKVTVRDTVLTVSHRPSLNGNSLNTIRTTKALHGTNQHLLNTINGNSHPHHNMTNGTQAQLGNKHHLNINHRPIMILPRPHNHQCHKPSQVLARLQSHKV